MPTKAELQARVTELETALRMAEERTAVLQEKESRYRLLVESAREAIMVVDRDGQFLVMNNAAARFLRGEPKDFLGKTIKDVFPPQVAEGMMTGIERVFTSGQGHVRELPIPFQGQASWYRSHTQPVKEDGGKVVSVLIVSTDITEQREAEKALQELQRIVNHSPAVAFLWRADENWTVEFVSDNVSQFGYTPEDFYSERVPYASIVHPDDLERVAAEVARHSEEGATEFVQQYRIITKTGEVRWTDDRTWVRRDAAGMITHYQGIVLDITERAQAETEHERLQQEIIEAQKQALQALSTPIIPVVGGIIVMPLVGSIDSQRARDITRTLLAGITEHRAKVVIMDITGVAVLDSSVVAHLNKTIQAARLKGSQTIVTGISNSVAETIVDLGIDWSEVETLRNLQSGLAAAAHRLGVKLGG